MKTDRRRVSAMLSDYLNVQKSLKQTGRSDRKAKPRVVKLRFQCKTPTSLAAVDNEMYAH